MRELARVAPPSFALGGEEGPTRLPARGFRQKKRAPAAGAETLEESKR
jgi:hypothetical protein